MPRIEKHKAHQFRLVLLCTWFTTVVSLSSAGFLCSTNNIRRNNGSLFAVDKSTKSKTSNLQFTCAPDGKPPRDDTVRLNNIELNKKEENNNGETSDSITRRHLLFSLLASSASASELMGRNPPASAAELITDIIPSATSASVGGARLIIPPMDTRPHATITLSNGLRVVLCSDPSSNAAASAMDVHVGATSDPDEIPGMAHFNEHMLFLGTEKYPQEDSFTSFLSSNGGSSNAYTDSEDTVYYFNMNADEDSKLAEGLDRFASFFTGPLFTESATGRELNAIESENAKNLQADVFRNYQIEKSRANSQHPYSKFYTGNKETLLDGTKRQKIDLRTELIKFWGTYYSASQMSLAVVAPQSIDVLKKIVEETFNTIPNNPERAKIPPEDSWGGKIAPFTAGTSLIPGKKHVVEIVPVADLRQVVIMWPIVYTSDEDKKRQMYDKPSIYVSHLLGHEGPNSLLSYLKKKGWVNSLGSSTDADLSDFYTFEVSAELTSKGLAAVDDVVEAIFSYIKMMQEGKIPRYIFEEVLQISELEWRFLTKGGAGSYAMSLVKAMQEYPESLYVAGPRRVALRKTASGSLLESGKPRTGFSSDEELTDTMDATFSLISKLTVDDALVTVTSKTFEGKTNKREKWYGTNYNVRPIPLKTLMQWSNSASSSSLGISYPPPNVFIPSEKGLKVKIPIKNDEKSQSELIKERTKPVTPPQKIRDDEGDGRWTVYFKQDDRFGQPKAYAIFQLLTKEVLSSPEGAVLADLYQVCANDRLIEYAYDAGLTGLSFDVQVLPRGVRLTFGGYNDKLMQFSSYISAKLSQDVNSLLPANEDEFERYKDRLVRALAAFDVQQPYSHAIYYSSLLFLPKRFSYTNAQRREAIQQVSLADLTQYVKGLWKSGRGLALLQGNIDKKEALEFVNVLDKTLAFQTISADDIPPRLTPLTLPVVPKDGFPNRITVLEPNPSNKNAASQVTFQSLGTTEKAHVLIEVLSSILSDQFYEDLRTKQQLGYIVSAGIKGIADTRNISFICQSSIVPTQTITTEILKFVNSAREKFLEPLTEDAVTVYTRALILQRFEPDKKLPTEASRNWNEISTNRFQFDRLQKEAAALRKIKKEDILEFWDDVILGVSGGRRVLLSETVPQSGEASSKAPPKSTGYGQSSTETEGSVTLGEKDIDAYRMSREMSG